MKKQTGITLIALVITIIVLLILAGVTILTLTGDNGLLSKVGEAKTATEEAKFEEEIKLLKFEYEMVKKEGKFSGSCDDYILNKKYGVQIGDIVNYDELSNGNKSYRPDTTKGVGQGYISQTKDTTTGKYIINSGTFTTNNVGWRVLGVNNKGQLELISDNVTKNEVCLANEEGYLYGPDELNRMCDELYGKGNEAISARSLNVDDIDKLAGITTGVDKKALNASYGNIYQFRFPTEQEVTGERKLQARVNSGTGYGDWKNSHYSSTYRMPGETKSISIDNPGYSKEVEYDHYQYTISEKVIRNYSRWKKYGRYNM